MADREQIFGIDRRRAVVTAVVAVVLLAGAVALIGRVADFHKVLAALRKADRVWFPVCLGGELLAYAGYIVAYRDVARADGGPCFSLWQSTRIVAIGFGAFVAGSSAGTLGLDFWALHRAGDAPHAAARRVLALNTIEWAVLATFAWVAGLVLALGVGSGGAPLAMELAWLVVVPACVAAALRVSAPSRAERLASLPHEDVDLERDPRTWPRWAWEKGREGFADAVGGVVLVRHVFARPRSHFGAVIGYPLYWAGDILTLWAALRAFGTTVDIAALVLAYTTAYVVTALPLPAGGAGGVEAGVAFSLTAVGVPLAPALLAVLVYRFFTLWLPIGPAILAVSRVRTLSDELPEVEHAPAGNQAVLEGTR